MIKLWTFALSFAASKLAFASVTTALSKGVYLFFAPMIGAISKYFDNNFPNIGYWMLSILIAGVSLLFLLTSKDDPLLKFFFIDKLVGVILISVAVLVVLQPYIGFSIL